MIQFCCYFRGLLGTASLCPNRLCQFARSAISQDHRWGGRFLILLPQYSAWFLQNSHEDIIEVLARGPDYTTYRVRVQVHQANDAGQDQSEVRAGPGQSPHPTP